MSSRYLYSPYSRSAPLMTHTRTALSISNQQPILPRAAGPTRTVWMLATVRKAGLFLTSRQGSCRRNFFYFNFTMVIIGNTRVEDNLDASNHS